MPKVAVIGTSISSGFLEHIEGRRVVIACDAFRGGIQNKHTPWPLAEQMLDKVIEDVLVAESILVMFNTEFLELLKVNCPEVLSKVTFLADAPLEKLFAEVVYKVRALYLKETSWTNKVARGKVSSEVWRRLMKMNAAADVTLTNPPYNGGLDLKILLAMNEAKLLKKVVCVHPSTWLVDVKTQLGPKTGNPLFRKFQDMVRDHVSRVTMFNGNPVFGIGLFVPCVVTELDMGWVRPQGTAIKVKEVGQEEYREVFGLEDITLHGKDWDPDVKEFMGRVRKLCEKNGALVNHREPDVGKWPTLGHAVQLAPMVGNWTASSCLKMVKDDFYTFLQKDPERNKRNDATDGRFHTFGFASATEQDNAIGFLQTDFARLCLALLKTSQNSYQGDMAFVPWLDFTRSWNDDQLFSMLGYPRGHNIREYAKRFLPDYHNIYPNGKTY